MATPAPLVLVPWFGDVKRFTPLARKWLDAHAVSGCSWEARFISNDALPVDVATAYDAFEVSDFEDLIRPNQAFDLKAAVVMAALLNYTDRDLLVLDLDAVLQHDPAPMLSRFRGAPIAMAIDHGAIIHYRARNFDFPYGTVRKLNAGVQWFPAGHDHRALVDGYRAAWLELAALKQLPWTPPLPHLLEQYAWCLCSHRLGGLVLPPAMNWSPDFLAENPAAIVSHRYGLPKWRD